MALGLLKRRKKAKPPIAEFGSFKRKREQRRTLFGRRKELSAGEALKKSSEAAAAAKAKGREVIKLLDQLNASKDWVTKERLGLKIDRLHTERIALERKAAELKKLAEKK